MTPTTRTPLVLRFWPILVTVLGLCGGWAGGIYSAKAAVDVRLVRVETQAIAIKEDLDKHEQAQLKSNEALLEELKLLRGEVQNLAIAMAKRK